MRTYVAAVLVNYIGLQEGIADIAVFLYIGGGGSKYYLRAVEDCHSRFLENGWVNTYF